MSRVDLSSHVGTVHRMNHSPEPDAPRVREVFLMSQIKRRIIAEAEHRKLSQRRT